MRADLLVDVDSRVRRLLKDEGTLRRDPSGMALAVIMVTLFGWLSWWIWIVGGSYRLLEIVFIPLALMGAFGFVNSTSKTQRDEGGRRQRRST